MLLKEIKDTNKWKVILYSWIRRLNIVQMIIAPKVMYKVSALPIKIPSFYFCRNRKLHLKLKWNLKRPQKSQNNLEKEEQS